MQKKANCETTVLSELLITFLTNKINNCTFVEKFDAKANSDYTPALSYDVKQVSFSFTERTVDEIIKRSKHFYELMNQRRTIRKFSSRPVPITVIKNIVRTAGKSV